MSSRWAPRLVHSLLRRGATWRLAAAAGTAWIVAAVPLSPPLVLCLCGGGALGAGLFFWLSPGSRRAGQRSIGSRGADHTGAPGATGAPTHSLSSWLLTVVVFAALAGAAVSAHEWRSLQGSDEYSGTLLLIGEPAQGPSGLYRYPASTPRGPVTVISRDHPPAAGTRIDVHLRLTGDGPEAAGFLNGTAHVREEPGTAWRVRERARTFLTDSSGTAHPGAALLPGLVVGDVRKVPEDLAEQMRTVSLSHVTAVSGSNIAIVNLTVMGLCRMLTRRRWLPVTAGLMVTAGYVFLVGPEPSALRAAGMGAVTALALLRRTGKNAPAILCMALTGLLIASPQLAVSAGFALSVAATGALLFLARPCTRLLARRVPEWAATALAVPICAQFGVLPILVMLGSAPSAWSVPANLLAAPAVAPATVLGMCVLGLGTVHIWVPGADQIGWLLAQVGAMASWWIAAIARIGAALPGAALPWPPGPLGIGLALALTLACIMALMFRSRFLRPSLVAGTVALTVGIVLPLAQARPVGQWSVAVCDVGQGSATAVSLGAGRALLVDVGPEPDTVDACLHRLRVQHLWIVLSHFDADHVAGLSGAVNGRTVHRLGISAPLADDSRAGQAERLAGVHADRLAAGAAFRAAGDSAGDAVGWEVVWPRDGGIAAPDGNGQSVVLRVSIGEHTVLIPGDIGREEQAALAARLAPVDVLVAPHHGSADLSEQFFTAAGARVGAVSVGENRYGHPTRAALRAFGAIPVLRTDQCGTIVFARDFSASGTQACRVGAPTPGRATADLANG